MKKSTTNPIYHHVADLGFGSSLQSIFQLALTPQRIEHFSDCWIRLRDSVNLLGIGGGPINVACLILFLEWISNQQLSIPSLLFFSQLAKLGNIGLTTGFAVLI